MSFVNIWIHAVWGTKNRYPYLKRTVKKDLLDHIFENANQKEIYIRVANAMEDHVHVLLSLSATMNIAETVQLIKGESSHWLNNKSILPNEFIWAKEYYAASISGHEVKHVIRYINEQEKHHRRITFQEECKLFMEKYGNSIQG